MTSKSIDTPSHNTSSILDDAKTTPGIAEDPADKFDPEPIDLTGRDLDGLRIERKIGKGGMGEVWLGHDEDLDIPVAVKVLPPKLAADQAFVMRFMREARAIAKLNHPNIVRVLQAGRRELDDQYLRVMVMEYVAGKDAKALLKTCPDKRMDPNDAATICLDTARALKYAHRKGVVHRDVKPANILVSDDLQVIRLLDFGLAKLQERLSESRAEKLGSQITDSDNILGTPHYMSPEQIHGLPVDGRADVYALGITLYHFLSGTFPFEGDSVFEVIEGHVRREMVFPPDAFASVPTTLRQLISGMTAKAPEDRLPIQETINTFKEFLGLSRQTQRLMIENRTVGIETNLAPRSTSFVGREEELKKLEVSYSEGSRVVSVLGPGGVGKTRFVQEYGLKVGRKYDGGVWFCDLTEAQTAHGICTAVGQGMGIALTQANPIEQLHLAMRYRGDMLLILDNFEQAVEHAPETLGVWMRETPKVHFLVSSREPLRIEGEKSFPLEPLGVGISRDTERITARILKERIEERAKKPKQLPPAVQLFVDRAKEVKRGFKLDVANKPAITRIVQELDGIPLAIELAASRVKAISPVKILQRMQRQFDLLQSKRRDTTKRQQTLRGAIDWSWQLLQPWEQLALAQCSIFKGGFFLEAAEAVIDLSDFPDAPFEMDVIETLCEKSLLREYEIDSLSGESRFRMLESIRVFAEEKLNELVESGAVAGDLRDDLVLRHADHYLEYAKEWSEALTGPEVVEAMDRLELELDNLFLIQDTFERRSTIGCSGTSDYETPHEVAARAIALLAAPLKTRGPWNERIPRMKRAVATLGERDDLILRTRLSLALANACHDCGSSEDMIEYTRQAEALVAGADANHEDYEELRLQVAQALANSHLRVGEFEEAETTIDAALERLGVGVDSGLKDYKSLDSSTQRAIAACLGNRGLVSFRRGKLDDALRCFKSAEEVFRAHYGLAGIASAVGNQGLIYMQCAELDEALEAFSDAEELYRELEDGSGIAANVIKRAIVLSDLGEFEKALECFSDGEAICRSRGSQMGIALVLGNRGNTLRVLGRTQESWQAYLGAEEICEEIGARHPLAFWRCGRAHLLLDAGMDLEDGRELALSCLTLLKETGTIESEIGFEALSALAGLSKKLDDIESALDAARRAKKLGEKLELPREYSVGPKAGSTTVYWQHVDEVLRAQNA